MSKARPVPDQFASGEQLTLFEDSIEDPRFGEDAVCSACKKPLWMHDKERVYPEDGPTGSWHHELVCP